MKCKKCKTECLESELTNGLCKKCLIKISNNEEVKSNFKANLKEISATVIISSIISIILSILVVGWSIIKVNGTNTSLSDFTVSELAMQKNEFEYTNSTQYSGKAYIYCKDAFNDYLVEVEIKHISGGNSSTIGETSYEAVVMHKGVAEVSTYDIIDNTNSISPKYEISVIGFRSFNI